MLISQDWVTRILGSAHSGWTVSSEELDSGFVRVGFETEGYEALPETTGPLVIGQVVEIEELTQFKKPIRYCQVNVGQANGTGELQGIICGARNFRLNDYVVVSLPGAELPGGFKIAARETYDHISNGMMCSAAELGFGPKADGIIVLGDEVADKVGQDARPIIGLADTVFDVNITPDRGYALSARGLSREIASAFDLTFPDVVQDPSVAGVDTAAVPEAQGTLIDVDLRDETKAQRFGLRKVSNIDPTARTPFWMERELMLSGQRSVNVATDVTNYVMLLLGAPMHAFDANVVSGDLVVRNAAEGEKFETLDHVTRELSAGDVVICDDNGIQSLAGVMGGTTSEVSDATTDVYFESAIWDPITVARTSRRHKLSSEASRRFERGVDPAIVEIALDVACALLQQIAGGTIEAGRTLVGDIAKREPITLRTTKPSEYAGVEYSRETVVTRLEEVGCTVIDNGETLEVSPATWRTDIGMDVDLIEEILRLEGLEDIPTVLPTPAGGRGLTPAQKRRRAIGHGLAYAGYAEVLPSPFVANDTFDTWGLDKDDARRRTVAVQNPLEADKAVLSTTLLPNMLEAIARNVARGRHDLALFGLQQVAFKRAEASPMPSVESRPSDEVVAELLDTLPEQPLHVATVATGNIEHEGPWGAGRAYSYADAIESARQVARAAGVDVTVKAAEQLPWHPGRCAAIVVAGQDGEENIVGYAGELHPQVLEALELPARTCAMELDVTALPLDEKFPAPVLSSFPALHQDIALVVDEETPAEQVRLVVEEGAGELLESVELFDVFRGEQLGEGKKSLAFQLLFRAGDRTLTDDEVNEHRLAAAELAKQRLGAEMRA
ncbi:phenylalanine--tRNA ligase subunit beta [Corynebacterium sp. FDAARGOS 1242]|uniref:phenylalanine--tRNA ligase subunit beta n=1 Tax=Corynebacterium sp. FDAARGOS 1242 TaxID=2778078 RepID=UPI00195097D9|nr:phenylalanine--tRNA ligase subunit beta [Corynebacterium sp. FDAARGOS 1242]QRP98738.1 phenylalanine--tRNA ligase subunit beta [Corynebacterium sp. FDAARGOS 1242]